MAARILIINDSQEILELFRELLTDEGYEVVLYSFAVTDLREIERVKPDLIIADYLFGGERTGWQLIQKIKMRRSTTKIPIVICTTATAQVREIEGYLQAQGIALVPKPFDIDELLNAVRRALVAPAYAAGLVAQTEEEDAEGSQADEAHAQPGSKRGGAGGE